eukprot:TRINITY_DN12188_c2_g1_i1.p1 TRINITY_DN12188_c2_g1~~TRINITY_DN12188_c2_g1_i1.p1  ORF type:complete len:132 (+),score=1.27 TRINITY_DN12188_c2_g1_i1:95-490(+)
MSGKKLLRGKQGEHLGKKSTLKTFLIQTLVNPSELQKNVPIFEFLALKTNISQYITQIYFRFLMVNVRSIKTKPILLEILNILGNLRIFGKKFLTYKLSNIYIHIYFLQITKTYNNITKQLELVLQLRKIL